MKKMLRRTALFGIGASSGWLASGWLRPNLPVLDGTAPVLSETGKTILNDASELSATPVHKHIVLKEDPNNALIKIIRQELVDAARDSRPVNVGAARHSMGGQAIPRNGTAITFANGRVEIDRAAQSYRAHAGARWSDVIAALDPVGLSPKVMQSNNDFGVAATFSVNAHGWPVPMGPMGTTVKSLRMVLPSGELVTCSATENTDLFNLAMGGYGLIGVIIDLDIEATRNTRLVPQFDEMPAEEFAAAFQAAVNDPAVTMAYGRLNVDRDNLFRQALLGTYRETRDQTDLPPASGSGWMSHVASRIYRNQLGSEPLKGFRWWNETYLGPKLGSGEVTRNSLINEPIATLDDGDPNRVDILHEYFIGFDAFDAFLTACREVIPASYQEILNVTLRYVAPDTQSYLSYAKVPRISAVMSFSQERTVRAEADMKRMTQRLIDRIVAIGGSYYLPYRPHARQDQFTAAYEQAGDFVQKKRLLDPNLILRNNLWDFYLSGGP